MYSIFFEKVESNQNNTALLSSDMYYLPTNAVLGRFNSKCFDYAILKEFKKIILGKLFGLRARTFKLRITGRCVHNISSKDYNYYQKEIFITSRLHIRHEKATP